MDLKGLCIYTSKSLNAQDHNLFWYDLGLLRTDLTSTLATTLDLEYLMLGEMEVSYLENDAADDENTASCRVQSWAL